MPPKMSTYDGIPAISPEQFDKLVELLTPGYELSKMMLEDYLARKQPDPSHIETNDTDPA